MLNAYTRRPGEIWDSGEGLAQAHIGFHLSIHGLNCQAVDPGKTNR